MPIKGKVQARYPNRLVMDSSQNTTYYLHYDYLVVTKKAIFIDLFAPLRLLEELDNEDVKEYVILRRIGNGLTQDDFELDLSEIDIVFEIEPTVIHNLYKKDSEFIVFKNPVIYIVEDIADSQIDNDTEDFENLEDKKLDDLRSLRDILTDKMILLRNNTLQSDTQEIKEDIKETEDQLKKIVAIIETKERK